MPSFPLMSELPPVVETTGWRWEPFTAPFYPSTGFWTGVDREGNRWLTKLTGGFCAYREIVFARLAQAMNWSCQSSVFMRLDRQSAQVLEEPAGSIHAAHWFLDEHPHPPCSTGCALEFLNKDIQTVEDLMGSNIAHLLDWPKSMFAAYVFGGLEPPGRLFTTAHEFVIIDSENMFHNGPSMFDTAPHWWNEPDGRPSRAGRALALEVCRNLSALLDSQIQTALQVPAGIKFRRTWPIAPKLAASRKFASRYCEVRTQVESH